MQDRIIQGRRGHLYFDSAELFLMVLDGKPAICSKWKAVGGRLWMGDISKNAQGPRWEQYCRDHRKSSKNGKSARHAKLVRWVGPGRPPKPRDDVQYRKMM